jgi:hypothetical protein
MINFEQVKEITLLVEQEWVMEVEGNLDNVQNTFDEINSCETLSDLVRFYEERGYDNKEAYGIIISNLMKFGSFI